MQLDVLKPNLARVVFFFFAWGNLVISGFPSKPAPLSNESPLSGYTCVHMH